LFHANNLLISLLIRLLIKLRSLWKLWTKSLYIYTYFYPTPFAGIHFIFPYWGVNLQSLCSI